MDLYALQPDYAVSYLEALENATPEERAEAFSRFGGEELPAIVSRSENSNEAVITIAGPLSPAGPGFIARLFGFGGTAYNDIIIAAKALENDPTVDIVRLAMDTPGGTVAGMDQARQALQSLASKKNLIAENHGMIASAGYYLATAAASIQAMTPLAQTGSIGVIIAGLDFSDARAKQGIKQIRIVSKNAPNKQPDPTTSKGRDVLQEQINAAERVFIDKIAEGRDVTEQAVIDNFGKGGMLIAQDPDEGKPDALSVGMIDNVITGNESAVDDSEIDPEKQNINASDSVNGGGNNTVTPEIKAAAGGGKQEGNPVMDLNTLKAEHPALCAQIEAAGVAKGVEQERARSDAHITMGQASGDMKYALSCVSDGTEHSPAVNAKHMAASITKTAIEARGAESEGDLEIDANTDSESEHDKALAKATADLLGVESDA